MNRKSFFKNILLAIGASAVPNVILKAIQPSAKINEGLFVQIDKQKFYWAEYESGDDGLKVFQGPKVDPTPVTFRLSKPYKCNP